MKEEETATTTTTTRNPSPDFVYTEDVLLPSLTLFLTRVSSPIECLYSLEFSLEFRMGITESSSTSRQDLPG